jgi:uncharacterized protein (DUF2236 family)
MTESVAALRLPTVREALATATALIGRCVGSLSAEDVGLFGPDSISWSIHRHPAYAVSAIAGLLMEALHPTAMAAIDQHSDYRRDAWRRAQRTASYVFTITFSARPEAEAAAERVRQIHSAVRGTDPSGRQYRADDDDLLLWIHSVNTEISLRGHEMFVRPLSLEQADRYVVEQRSAGALVGLDEHRLPATRDALHAAISGYELRLSAPAAEFAALLLGSKMPWTMRPFWALHVLGAIRLLPAEARAAYGFSPRLLIGGFGVLAVRLALQAMDWGYLLLPSVRRARRRLHEAARAHSRTG